MLVVKRPRSGREEHADTLSTASNLVHCLGQQRKWSDKEAVLRFLLAARRRTLGDEHMETIVITTFHLEGNGPDITKSPAGRRRVVLHKVLLS